MSKMVHYEGNPMVPRIVEHFVRLIESGELRPGDDLPTGPEIGKAFGTYPNVVVTARKELVRRNLVEVYKTAAKSGTRVK